MGLDSDETGNPPIKFKAVFVRARAEGCRLTMHCDVDQENSTRHIRQTLDDIGVDRIDRGVNALEDEALCDEIGRGKIDHPESSAALAANASEFFLHRAPEPASLTPP